MALISDNLGDLGDLGDQRYKISFLSSTVLCHQLLVLDPVDQSCSLDLHECTKTSCQSITENGCFSPKASLDAQ